jgi:Fe-S-cluster containining protein
MRGLRRGTVAAMAEVSTLCRRCGLCCDGSLFDSVPLTAEEARQGRARGLVIVARADGSPALRQRCAALGADGCGVYVDRPGRCRVYRCMLWTGLREGEVGLAEAEAVVDEARALLAAGLPEARAFVGRHFDRRVGS